MTTRASKIDYPKSKRATVMAGTRFNSIGSADDQQSNRELIHRLLAEIDGRGTLTLDAAATFFLDDCRLKFGAAAAPMFGLRQVDRMKEIHREVCGA